MRENRKPEPKAEYVDESGANSLGGNNDEERNIPRAPQGMRALDAGGEGGHEQGESQRDMTAELHFERNTDLQAPQPSGEGVGPYAQGSGYGGTVLGRAGEPEADEASPPPHGTGRSGYPDRARGRDPGPDEEESMGARGLASRHPGSYALQSESFAGEHVPDEAQDSEAEMRHREMGQGSSDVPSAFEEIVEFVHSFEEEVFPLDKERILEKAPREREITLAPDHTLNLSGVAQRLAAKEYANRNELLLSLQQALQQELLSR